VTSVDGATPAVDAYGAGGGTSAYTTWKWSWYDSRMTRATSRSTNASGSASSASR
jgi:hypothetical protein